ncbi:hypothetical protein GS534_24335 [Rhodococcus hoagii]|nr:hypothetical protein [Prescottella equi]MBM4617942.1 hypothetical protein [Prescottella equi]NKS33159.1 hypothetical protein [Prescottella equi]
MTWTPFEPHLIDGQRRPWGIAHLIDGLPHFHKIDGRIARFLSSAAAQEAADEVNAQAREQFRNLMDGIEPPVRSEHGVLRWSVVLVDDGDSFPRGHINVEHSRWAGNDQLSLTGIPWTLTPKDAEIVASAMQNAARWLDRHPNPYLAERD